MLFAVMLFFGGCDKKKSEEKQVILSFIIPSPTKQQILHYYNGIYIYTSKKEKSILSSIVVNNPVECGKEGILAIAVKNLTQKPIQIKWNDIVLESPGQKIRLMPIEMMPDYFKRPDCAKPMINFKESGEILRKFLLKYSREDKSIIFDSERELADLYKKIRDDLTYHKMPAKNILGPNRTTVGYLVILFSQKPENCAGRFTLKIPVGNDFHILHYNFHPID